MNQKETANSSVRIFLHIIFKRKIQILLFFTITLIIVGAYTTGVEESYVANSEILVKVGQENVYKAPGEESGMPLLAFSSMEQINSEIELIKSQPLIEKVVDTIGPAALYADIAEDYPKTAQPGIVEKIRAKLNLDKLFGFFNQKIGVIPGAPFQKESLSARDKAILRVQDNLTITGVKNSRVIDVSFEHSNPQICALVVKTLVDVYLEVRPQVHKNPQSYAFFQEQSKNLKDKIKLAEAALDRFRSQHNVIALEEERTLLLAKKADLEAQLNQSLSASVETQNRITQIQKQLKMTPDKIQQGETTNSNPYLINTLEERLVTLEIKERELLTKYTEENHLVQDVKKQLKLVRDKLAEQENKSYGSSNFGPNPTYQTLKQDLYQNEADLQAVNAKINVQQSHLAEYQKRLAELNSVENEMYELNSELALYRQNYTLYHSKHEESRINSEMEEREIANVSVIKPALLPLEPEGPKVAFNMAIGLFVAVFGSIGLALFLEFFNDSLERPEDIEEYLGAPVLASIPKSRR
jgi:uncharacterized protein involved in exopolysaccharide biosynthesis